MIVQNNTWWMARDLTVGTSRAVLPPYEPIQGSQFAKPGWVWISDSHLAALQALPSDDVRSLTLNACQLLADASAQAADLLAGRTRVTVSVRVGF